MNIKTQRVSLRRLLIPMCALLITACSSAPVSPTISDKDNDSVSDALDNCPLTALGTPVDLTGCSLFRGNIEDVQFAPGDHRLDAKSRESLSKLVELLNTYPDVSIQLGGHTDNRGSARENLELSKRRVMSVVRYLVANGISAERLKPFGYGESRPVVSNATASGREKNRRIEMSVVTQ